MENLDEEALEYIQFLYMEEALDSAEVVDPDDEPWECTACNEIHTGAGLQDLGCGCNFCVPCLESWVKVVLDTEAKYPMSCCDRIPDGLIMALISKDLEDQFRQKLIEYKTPGVDRIYCCKKHCSTFIDQSNIGKTIARCPACEAETCLGCRMEAHYGGCIKDEETQQLLDMASPRGWKPCYMCGTLVERLDGCNHMTYELTPGLAQ
ncbi:hypothetical protein PG993_010560 [Apiospora rasikravindrae]|uniref:RBR-type E3 ubiquitin transferase n=1 Tax=Apiospora rasikravindrae TaxID=990691 RepID=A0ABR1SML2_9PEZI